MQAHRGSERPRRRPSPTLTWFMHAPTVIFRLRLGWIFAGRLLMLTTVGRSSGTARRTVLEVARYDHETGTYWVVAGWGRQSDWYRNALAHPPLRVDVGRKRFAPTVRPLSVEEVIDVLADYQRRYPRFARTLGRRLLDQDFTDRAPDLRAIAEATGALEIRPRGRPVRAPL